MAVEYNNGDGPYLAWLQANPTGYVLNTGRSLPPEYMVLHRANCSSISVLVPPARPGGFTECDYVKICSDSVADLSTWVRQHRRPSGAFSKRCPRCNP
jgi:hypothetical protein